MAGYTSRFFLTLTVPSVFGFLSVLWFLRRKSNSPAKQISKGIQVVESTENLILDPMKLKKQSGIQYEDVSSSEMQLKETQSVQAQNSNGVQENGKAKGKKKVKSKVRETETTCARDSVVTKQDDTENHSSADNNSDLANGIEALELTSSASGKDEIHMNAINKTLSEMEISNDTNSSFSHCKHSRNAKDSTVQILNGDVQDEVESAKELSKDTERNSVDGKICEEHISLSQTESSQPLTLPVECTEVQGDMLESPGATYCDSVGSNDSGKGGSEFQFVLEPQQVCTVYEFEILQELCGLLIGRNGKHVNFIKQETNANILIKRHPYFPHKKICSVTGTEEEIHSALKMIRKRFPIEVYPTVTLSQINSLLYELQLPETLKLCLPHGVTFEAMLCATVNAGHFFLQQPTHPTFHSLPALTTQMTALYNQLEAPTLTHVAKGYVCAANLTDGWFRAEVDEVFEDTDECRLKFLDYGGYTVVPRSSLRQIRYDFMYVPFQATECYLGSVTFLEGESEWSAEATAAFEELAQGQIVQGYIVGYHETTRIPYVHLHKITGATSVFINRELVSRGLARWLGNTQ